MSPQCCFETPNGSHAQVVYYIIEASHRSLCSLQVINPSEPELTTISEQ